MHFENNTRKQAVNLNLEELIYVNNISESQFGSVYLTRDPSRNLYVVKSFSKSMLEEFEVQKFVNDEKKILATLAFPFLVQLGRSFQSETHLFLLEEYICG